MAICPRTAKKQRRVEVDMLLHWRVSTGLRCCARFVRRYPLIEGLKAMQVPSILLGESRTRLLQGIRYPN
jgi:hypothetical protein